MHLLKKRDCFYLVAKSNLLRKFTQRDFSLFYRQSFDASVYGIIDYDSEMRFVLASNMQRRFSRSDGKFPFAHYVTSNTT